MSAAEELPFTAEQLERWLEHPARRPIEHDSREVRGRKAPAAALDFSKEPTGKDPHALSFRP